MTGNSLGAASERFHRSRVHYLSISQLLIGPERERLKSGSRTRMHMHPPTYNIISYALSSRPGPAGPAHKPYYWCYA
jgi:hypothetical protein